MQKTLDTEYPYRNSSNSGSSSCRVRVYEDIDERGCPVGREGRSIRTVVVATMSMDCPEQGSIVNDAEDIATEIRDVQQIRLRHRFRRWMPEVRVGEFIWIQQVMEHERDCLPDTFDFVSFEENGTFRRPTWTKTDRPSVEALIGQALN